MRVYFSTCRFVGFCCPVIQVHLMPCPSVDPKVLGWTQNLKKVLWVSIFWCVDLLVFVVPPFKYTQLMPCPFVEPKLFWVSPKFFGWTQNLEKSPQCVSFLVQSKNIWTREKVQIFFGPIEGWGMNDWCLSIGGKHEWSWVGFNTMVKINKILCMNSPI